MSDTAFVARVSRARVLRHVLMFAASAAIMAVLTVVITRGMPANSLGWTARLIGGALVLMFLYCTFLVGRSFFHREAAMIIDAHGLHMPGCFDDPLPWGAIARAEIGSKRLNLWFAEGTALPSNKAVRRLIGNNKVIGKPNLPVSMLLTDRRLDELVEAIRARAPQLFA